MIGQAVKTYAPQKCAWCKGGGKQTVSPGNITSCVVCGGKGHLAVVEPAVLCRHCEGTGRRNERSACLVCAGRGWEK